VQAVRDAFEFFERALAIFAAAEMSEDVLVAPLGAPSHFVPKRFDVTTPH
jgi:hypothetical protein